MKNKDDIDMMDFYPELVSKKAPSIDEMSLKEKDKPVNLILYRSIQ